MSKSTASTKRVVKKAIPRKKVSTKKKVIKQKSKRKPITKKRLYLTLITLLLLAVLLIFSTYAWFSTTLNVKIKTFNMLVTKNAGLEISFDAVNYAQAIEISDEVLFEDIPRYYPNHKSFWANDGLVPISTIGNQNPNSYFFDIYRSPGVKYYDVLHRKGAYILTRYYSQNVPVRYSGFLAFDLFIRNDNNDSPVADNFYFDVGTGVEFADDISEQMRGLINSIRIGIIKVGSTDINSSPNVVQNLQCNNDCKAIIYEPNSLSHTQMAIDNAKRYDLTVVDGEYYPTYANIKQLDRVDIKDTLSGSPTLDTNAFGLQKTITEDDFYKPLFKVPHGITKARVYVWIEGGDIDSIETDSEGTEISLTMNFVKDTYGWDSFD